MIAMPSAFRCRSASVQSKQELRWIVALVEERMPGRSVAIKTFEIKLRAAGIVQFGGIDVGSQGRPVGRNVVSDKLAEDRPTSRGLAKGVRIVFDVSAIAYSAFASERVQELLVCLETTAARETSGHKSWGLVVRRLPPWPAPATGNEFEMIGGLVHQAFHFKLLNCGESSAVLHYAARCFSIRRSGINQISAAITKTA